MKGWLLVAVAVTVGIFIFYSRHPDISKNEPLQGLQTTQKAMVDFGSQHAAWFEVQDPMEKTTEVNASWNVWEQPIPDQTYLVDGPRVEAYGWNRFQNMVTSDFKEKQKNLETIPLNEVDDLPHASLIILATGAIPENWLNNETIDGLIRKNDTVVFVGLPFSIATDPDGIVVQNKTRGNDVAERLGFEYTPAETVPPRKHAFVEGRYGLRLKGQDHKTSIYIQDQTSFTVQYQNQGNLVVIPNTLDQGWTDPAIAAHEISQLVMDAQWQPALAEKTQKRVLQPGLNDWYSPPFRKDHAYARLEINQGNQTFEFSAAVQSKNGHLEQKPVSDPGINESVSATLDESYATPETIGLFLYGFQNGAVRFNQTVGSITLRNLGLLSTELDGNVSPGDYLLQLEDSNHTVYAQSQWHVRNTTAQFIQEDYASGAFQIRILSDGEAVPDSAFRISMDGGAEKIVSTDPEGTTRFTMPNRPAPTHAFRIKGPDQTIVVVRNAGETSFMTQPAALLAVLVTAALFCAGYVFGTKPKKHVYIDVPDFPNPAIVERKVTEKILVRALERAKKKYAPSTMAISIEEFKEALREELSMNPAEALAESDVERILEELQGKKILKKSSGRFILTSWEKRSGNSAECLGLQRRMVEELLKAGIVFEEKKNVLITAHAQLYTYTCDGGGIDPKGIRKKLLVFPDEDTKKQWLSQIRSSPKTECIRASLGLQNQIFKPVTLNQLGNEVRP